MPRRDKSYWKPHRAKQKSIDRVHDTQAEQRGEGVQWQGAQGSNRHERRRLGKGVRKYDKLHGEGAAAEFIRANGLEDEAIVRDVVGKSDRERAGAGAQDAGDSRFNDLLDARLAAAVNEQTRGSRRKGT